MTKLLDRIRNGVDSEQMYGTLDAIKATPELGVFQFRAHNRWIDGAHNRSTIQGFYGAGQEDTTRAEIRVALPQTGRAMVKDEDVCVHCGLCAERCPTAACDMQKFDLIIPYAGAACTTSSVPA